MGRFFIYLLVIYVFLFLIKLLIRFWRNKPGFRSGGFFKRNMPRNKSDGAYDKSKAVDADFEEIN